MSIEERVADFLRRNGGKDFCDECIAHHVGITRQQVRSVTSALGVTREFDLAQDQCSECGKNKKVIHTT